MPLHTCMQPVQHAARKCNVDAAVAVVRSTACTPMQEGEVQLRQRVKCVTDVNGYALYFSRGMLPHNKEGAPRPFPSPFQDKPYLLHLGLQCYDRHFLSKYCVMEPTPLMVRTRPLPHLSRWPLLPRGAHANTPVNAVI